MADTWLDYSGARPDPHELKRLGVVGVLRYLSEPIPATTWKRITVDEKDAILDAGLDLILNFEWYEGRMLEGYSAGLHDGKTALAQAQALGYPKGSSIYFSHDTSSRDDAAILAYMRGAKEALGGYYEADIYSGIDVVEMVIRAGLARFGWQTIAWSRGQVGSAHLYQNGNQWFNGGCDENKVLHAGLGSWGNHTVAVSPPPAPASSGDKPLDSVYTIVEGDTLTAIATRFHTSVDQLMAWNRGLIINANDIQVGWKIKVAAGGPVPAPAPVPKPMPKPVSSGKYVVRSGDNLTVIAQRFHTTVSELLRLNPSLRSHPNLIRIGEVLAVPGGAAPAAGPITYVKRYRVVAGDNLSVIARRYGTSIKQLVAWNRPLIRNPNLIQAGWVLRVG